MKRCINKRKEPRIVEIPRLLLVAGGGLEPLTCVFAYICVYWCVTAESLKFQVFEAVFADFSTVRKNYVFGHKSCKNGAYEKADSSAFFYYREGLLLCRCMEKQKYFSHAKSRSILPRLLCVSIKKEVIPADRLRAACLGSERLDLVRHGRCGDICSDGNRSA